MTGVGALFTAVTTAIVVSVVMIAAVELMSAGVVFIVFGAGSAAENGVDSEAGFRRRRW